MEREPDDEGDESEAEPSLGSFDLMMDQGKSWRQRETWFNGTTDLEADNAESEPCLGSLDHMTNQTRWAEGGTNDAEDEHDGSEPDNDGEPSFGAFQGHENQDMSYAVSDAGIAFIHDAELDGAESGIADQDGLDEQVPFRDWQNVGMV